MRLDFQKPSPKNNQTVRLQKYLAACGLGSRRACEQLIEKGGVAVNGTPVNRQGVVIDPEHDRVTLDGNVVVPDRRVYYLLNKPRDVLCTNDDPHGRRTYLDLLPSRHERVFYVGRLDRNSEGLLLVTNDGELTNQLTHPRHHAQKTYHVMVHGTLTDGMIRQMQQGIRDRGETLKAISIRRLSDVGLNACYELVLGEGRNRQIRRMFEACGFEIQRLVRVKMGPLELGSLRSGECRELTALELKRLRNWTA